MIKRPWNIVCPTCHDIHAYQGFMTCECINPKCKYFSKTQQNMVQKYQLDLEALEKELADTIPRSYTPEGYYSTCSELELDTCSTTDDSLD